MLKYTKLQILLITMPIILGSITIFFIPYFLFFLTKEMETTKTYWYLRSEPLLKLVLVPIISLVYTTSQKFYLRKAIALVSIAFFSFISLYYINSEINRLGPYVNQQEITWSYALRFTDLMVVFGITIGIFFSVIQIIAIYPRTSNVKRAKKGIFGNASWMTLKDAGKIFPKKW